MLEDFEYNLEVILHETCAQLYISAIAQISSQMVMLENDDGRHLALTKVYIYHKSIPLVTFTYMN